MKNHLIVLIIAISINSYGQAEISSDTLHWSSNRLLSWDDFKGEPIEGIGLHGEVFCMNLANFERPNAFQKTKFKVVAIFDRTKSWIIEEYQSDIGLTYFQIMFNIYEVHARGLRKELTNSKFGSDPTPIFQEKYNNSMTYLIDEFNQFRKETKLGRDTKILMEWKNKVEEELMALNDFAH